MHTQLAGLWHTLRTRLQQHAAPDDAGMYPRAAPQPEEPQRVGLVLSGGGGKGGAHLGVLAVLAELDVPIDLIVGSSIGGAVGVLYAAGLSLDEIEQAFRDVALRRIALPDPTRTGLIGARKREQILVNLLGDRTFADLHIPCAVVATDLVSGCEVVIDQGPLVPAIMATTAVPGLFPPVVSAQQVLADGSILNNVPVDVAKRRGAQRVIAVELSNPDALPRFELHVTVPGNPLERLTLTPRQLAVANRALDLLMAQAAALRLAQHPPAVLLRPEVSHISMLDMARAEESRRIGEESARAAIPELLALRDWRLPPPPPPAPETSSASAPRHFNLGLRLPRWRSTPPIAKSRQTART